MCSPPFSIAVFSIPEKQNTVYQFVGAFFQKGGKFRLLSGRMVDVAAGKWYTGSNP
jgi:hypothetical protein